MDADVEKIEQFFREDGTLISIPAKSSKRLAVLYRIAGQFAAGSAGLAFWSRADPIPCRDGKYRLVEPGVFPLAHGATGRVGRLRAYGSAIVPQVGAAFVRAFLAC